MKKLTIILFLICTLSTSINLFAQDTLKYSVLQNGIRPKGDFTFYQSKDGYVYKIGDRLKIGVPSSNKTFAFIMSGDMILTHMVPLDAFASGTETEIKSFIVGGSKRSGFMVFARGKGMVSIANYGIQLENAIAAGEIKSFGKSSDDALAELKKAKDKLDLGLITQDAYDIIKSDLVKYIK